MSEYEKVAESADKVFKQLHSKLPYNKIKVYIEVYCEYSKTLLYIPTLAQESTRLQTEKEQWQRLVTYAKY